MEVLKRGGVLQSPVQRGFVVKIDTLIYRNRAFQAQAPDSGELGKVEVLWLGAE